VTAAASPSIAARILTSRSRRSACTRSASPCIRK
jgi:hypothetical protein